MKRVYGYEKTYMGKCKMKKSVLIFSLLLLVLSFPIYSFGGCIKGDCENGQGTFTLPDGSKYVGGWKDHKFDGQGTLTYSDGSKHVGKWKDHRKHGQGTFTSSDGSKYVGGWKNGEWDGQGTITLPDGTKYVGGVKNSELQD